MLKALGILAIAAVIIAMDVPPLIKKKQRNDLWVFAILLSIGVILSVLMGFGVDLPNPLDFMKWVFQPVTDLIHNMLHEKGN